MSMIGNFLQRTSAELDALIANPADVESFIYPDEDENENCIDIDKAWHGIHFMLTGTQYDGDPPLSNVIFSGATIGDDVGYGPARYLTPTEVAEVAEALRSIPPDDLAKRYDAAALTANDIYPQIWGGDEDLEYILSWYGTLRDYYADAASKGNAMLQYLN